MSQLEPAPASAGSAPVSSRAGTRLNGRWLVLARFGWLLAVISTLALFLGSLPTYYARLQMPCVGAIACNLNGALSAEAMRELQAGGLSASAYAAYTVVLTMVITLVWSAVALIIFWRRSDDWMALLAS